MKERNYSLDLMRVLACIMIVCMHSPMPNDRAISFFNLSISYLTAPGLCLFFVISGSLLLPIKMDAKTFLRKRLGKVVVPTLVFTGVYLLLNYLTGVDQNLTKSILSIPFSAQGHGVLWFMYTLVGLYLISPIVSKWLETVSKRELEFYLFLWAITLCYPILKLFVVINDSDTGYLYYFSGYIGYFVLGHYLKKYPDAISLKMLILPIIISLVAPIVCKLYGVEGGLYAYFWYLSIFVAVLCVTYYKLISHFHLVEGRKFTNFITLTSNLSFGIYLIHIAIMRFFVWEMDCINNINNYIVQWAVVVVLTFSLSWLAAYLISLLPFGNYIIGYKQKR